MRKLFIAITATILLVAIGIASNAIAHAVCQIPDRPQTPSPSNGSSGVSTDCVLHWSDCTGASSYDIYLGTSLPPSYHGSVGTISCPGGGNCYPLFDLNYSTKYYWQVVARNDCGVNSSEIWNFTTVSASTTPTYTPPPRPVLLNITVIDNDGSNTINGGDTLVFEFSHEMKISIIDTPGEVNQYLDSSAVGTPPASWDYGSTNCLVYWDVSHTQLYYVLGTDEHINGGEFVNPSDAVTDIFDAPDETLGAGVQIPTLTACTYSLSLMPSPSGSGNPTGGGIYNCGAVAHISANISSAYTFLGWYPTDGVADPSAANTTVTMTQSRSIAANAVAKTTPTSTPTSTPANQNLVAYFTYSPIDPKAGKPVVFDASASSGAIRFYCWDLNNDSVYEISTLQPRIECQWNEAGVKNITLTVTDDNNAENTINKDVTIGASFWDKVGDFIPDLWPFDTDVKKIEDTDLSLIKQKLDIDQWLLTTRFSIYTDSDLMNALNQEVDPIRAPGLTYGIQLLNGISEYEMIENVLSQQYKTRYAEYFEGWLDANGVNPDQGWAKILTDRLGDSVEQFSFGILGDACPIGEFGLSLALDAAKLGEVLVPLKELDYYNTLWSYFYNRDSGMNHDEAWDWACSDPWALNYFQEDYKVEQYFKNLWETYNPYLVTCPPCLDEAGIKAELRDIFQAALESYSLPDRYMVKVGSPVELRVYDSNGNVTGLVDGEVKEEIPFSAYDNETEMVVIFHPTDSYHYVLVGTGKGTYNLSVDQIKDGIVSTFTANNIPSSHGEESRYSVDWDALLQNQNGVTLQIDSNGDGIFEKSITSDSVLTQDDYLAATGESTSGKGTPTWVWIVIGSISILAVLLVAIIYRVKFKPVAKVVKRKK